MDMKTFSRREKAARLSEKLLAIEEKRNQGQRGYSPEEVYDILGQVINVVISVKEENLQMAVLGTEKEKSGLNAGITIA